MKKGNIQSAPLYVVYGSLTTNNSPSVRAYGLRKAKNKDGVWYYWADDRTVMIPDRMLGEIDEHPAKGNKRVYKVFFREQKLINSWIEQMNFKMCQLAGKPVDTLKPAVTKLREAVKSEGSKKAKEAVVKSIVEKPVVVEKPKAEKMSKENATLPKGAKQFTGKDLEDYIAIQNILNGHQQEFAVIHKRYYPTILYKYSKCFNFQNNELAEDLASEVSMKIYEKLSQYVPEHTVNAWISKIARNYFIDYTRKAKLQTVSISKVFGSEEDGESVTLENFLPADTKTCPDEMYLSDERKQAVHKVLATLDERVRRMVIMRFFYNASYADIMKQENVNESYVKITIHRAKNKLREMLQGRPQLLAAMTV